MVMVQPVIAMRAAQKSCVPPHEGQWWIRFFWIDSMGWDKFFWLGKPSEVTYALDARVDSLYPVAPRFCGLSCRRLTHSSSLSHCGDRHCLSIPHWSSDSLGSARQAEGGIRLNLTLCLMSCSPQWNLLQTYPAACKGAAAPLCLAFAASNAPNDFCAFSFVDMQLNCASTSRLQVICLRLRLKMLGCQVIGTLCTALLIFQLSLPSFSGNILRQDC